MLAWDLKPGSQSQSRSLNLNLKVDMSLLKARSLRADTSLADPSNLSKVTHTTFEFFHAPLVSTVLIDSEAKTAHICIRSYAVDTFV